MWDPSKQKQNKQKNKPLSIFLAHVVLKTVFVSIISWNKLDIRFSWDKTDGEILRTNSSCCTSFFSFLRMLRKNRFNFDSAHFHLLSLANSSIIIFPFYFLIFFSFAFAFTFSFLHRCLRILLESNH